VVAWCRTLPRRPSFRVSRNGAGHVGFGFGDHACVGTGVARLVGSAVPGGLMGRSKGSTCPPSGAPAGRPRPVVPVDSRRHPSGL